jgi:hypothetical protein
MRYSPVAASLLTLASHREVLAKAAHCECGYTVNRTTDSQFEVFTDYFESDFLHIPTGAAVEADDFIKWLPQHYNTSAKMSRGGFGTSKKESNVISNAFEDGEWDGEIAGDPGMKLFVRHELEDDQAPVAEVSSSRNDILYGSFRAAIKFTDVNGTCGAFFWYHNDTQEIDMEFLSKDPKTLNLVVHSPESDKPSRSIKGSGDLGVVETPGSSTAWESIIKFAQEFHEYRFDWMPDRIQFYVDGLLAWTTTENIPDSPGHLMLSHWSNGNPGWSDGPPMQDAVMEVGYVKAYFNTTSSGDEPKAECRELHADTLCVVPDQTSPPFTHGYKTHFCSMPDNKHYEEDSTFKASGSDVKSDHSSAASFGMSSFVWYFVGAVCSIVYCLA